MDDRVIVITICFVFIFIDWGKFDLIKEGIELHW